MTLVRVFLRGVDYFFFPFILLKDARANATLGSDSFVVWVKENFLSDIGFSSQEFSHLKSIMTPKPIKEIAEAVVVEYGLKLGDIIRK